MPFSLIIVKYRLTTFRKDEERIKFPSFVPAARFKMSLHLK